jgi:cellulose synthase/poly-beta-1,6-N-acetylglucosamine synthase-like glycosyltransferase
MHRIFREKDKDNNEKVRGSLIWLVFIIFGIVNYGLSGIYADYVVSQPTATLKILSATILAWLVFSSFFASYHFLSFAFSVFDLFKGALTKRNYKSEPSVAVLYLCRDDFNEGAFLSCLQQNYANYRVYVLDDSSLANQKHRVASICRKHSDSVSLIRRVNPSSGFKAGNINNALKEIPPDVRYICLLDADEMIPTDFVRETVAICEENESIAFVQASHTQYGLSRFGKQIGESIDLHWKYFLTARNKRGFVYTFGHGVTFRLAAIRAVGGFPEVVAEDIAISTELRRGGFRGYFAPDIVCSEETPPSYTAFRRRNRKITKGTLQFLSEFYIPLFRNNAVTVTEKIDLLFASLVSLLPAAFFVFLIVAGLFTMFDNVIQATESNSGTDVYSVVQLVPVEITILAFATIFSPLVYLLPSALRSPYRTLAFVFRGAAIHLSLCFDAFRSTTEWARTKHVEFRATGSKSDDQELDDEGLLDGCLGILIMFVAVLFGSPFLASAGLALFLVPQLIKRNLDGALTSVLVVFPAALTLVGLFAAPEAAVAATGIFAGVALAHH